MKITDTQRRNLKERQKERAKAAADARRRVQNTEIPWDHFIARIKHILDNTDKPRITNDEIGDLF